MVIVVPTIPLMGQWKSELLRSDVPESAIALMGGGEQPGLLATSRILICVLNSARQKLPDLVRKAGWPERMLLVVDECHRAKPAEAKKIFAVGARSALGLSATTESADDDSREAARKVADGRLTALGEIVMHDRRRAPASVDVTLVPRGHTLLAGL